MREKTDLSTVTSEAKLPLSSIHDQLVVVDVCSAQGPDVWEVWEKKECIFAGTEAACDRFVQEKRRSNG